MRQQYPNRRQFLTRTAVIAAVASIPGPHPAATAGEPSGCPHPGAGLTDTSASPHAMVRSVGLGEVRWTRGFWADRVAACRDAMVPTMGRLMSGTEPSQFLHNFKVAAGL